MKKIFTNERLVIVILLLLMVFGVGYHFNTIGNKNDKYEAEIKLREALQDSMRTTINVNGELVQTKRTLQGKLTDLIDENIKLNADQKELLDRLKAEKNRGNTISAALIRSEIRIDSLENLVATASEIDTTKNTVRFAELDTTKHFNYDLTVGGVKPVSLSITPTLRFNNISFPNKQFITFQFDENKRKDYPVSFSVSNSNPYYKVINIESYVIPGVQKDVVNPTGWQKVWKFMKVNGKYIIVGVGGFALGTALAK